MWPFSKPGAPLPSRKSLLAAIPLKNPAVRETVLTPKSNHLGASTLRLTAPLAHANRKKSFDLDELGAFVWQSADGTKSVEHLIRHFAEEKRITLRESEVAVLSFLKTLTRKNLLALNIRKSSEK